VASPAGEIAQLAADRSGTGSTGSKAAKKQF
jgi:hypothetical protein